MPVTQAADRQKQLKKFIERRHPSYEEMAPHWAFLEQTYEGGRGWFATNIFKYLKEGKKEFADRKTRAYRFNHTREVVDLVDKYLFKMEITRDEGRAPECVKKFWKHSTLNKASIRDFMKRVSNRVGVFGRVWIVVDSSMREGAVTVADEKKLGARTYAYILSPQHVLDMGYDELGELVWILVLETGRDDDDPMNSTGNILERYRLWTRTSSQRFDVARTKEKCVITEQPEVAHSMGCVPVFAADNVISDERYTSPALIADVAYLDRAVANYLSNLDAIIQDQTFSQLVMPANNVTPGSDGYDKMVEMGTKRIFTYDAENGGKPEYISPDVKQAELILSIISKIVNEIYHSVGLAGERTKEDNSQGIDNSSGVAKAYDFERVNSLLAAKGDSLQVIENKLTWMVAKWNGEEGKIEALEKDLIEYPNDFDVRGLYDEFQIAARLQLIQAPDAVRREQMDALVDKLFPQLQEDVKTKIKEELKTWPPEIVMEGPGATAPDAISKAGKNSLANELVK